MGELLACAPLVLWLSPVALVGALWPRRRWSAAAILLAGFLSATAVLPRGFADGAFAAAVRRPGPSGYFRDPSRPRPPCFL